MLRERGRHVDPRRVLDALPAGDAVDLEHVVAPVARAQEVDAGVVGAKGGRRGHTYAPLLRVEPYRARAPTACEVRAPAFATTLDRGRHPLADDERSYVAAGVRQRFLQVVHGSFELQRAEHPLRDVGIVHAHHADPHRAEQRLDDHVAAELGERLQGVGGPLAGDRARGGQAGAGQQGRGEELVDGPLDRVRAVDRAHAAGGKRVQHVHAEDDLLERAARDAAHEHHVAAVERQLARAHAEAAALDAAHHPRHGSEVALVAARRQSPFQSTSVPAAG